MLNSLPSHVQTHFIRFPLDVYTAHVRHRLTAVARIPPILGLFDDELSTARTSLREQKACGCLG
jgi:hypothetical protein